MFIFCIDVSTLSIYWQSFTKSDSILHNFKFEQSNIYPYITKPNHKYLKRNFWYCGYLKRRYLNATFGIVELFFGMGSQPDCTGAITPPPPFNTSFEKGLYSSFVLMFQPCLYFRNHLQSLIPFFIILNWSRAIFIHI